MLQMTDPAVAIHEILDEAIKADDAVKGNVQWLNPRIGALEIIAQRGFDESFLKTFRVVRADEPSACGRALRFNRRVIISDIRSDLFYWPYLSIADAAGYRAVQSTPIITPDGLAIGILSTHFARVHRLTNRAAKILDDCADNMAKLMAENF